MDLRQYKITEEQLAEAAQLACDGLICYQPFEFSDDLMTGAGYEFAKIAEGAGMVYAKTLPAKVDPASEGVKRHLIDPAILPDFQVYNRQLDDLYQSMIGLVTDNLGDPSKLSFADVGSCTGYFPIAFSQLGAKESVGFDAVDYSRTFNLMNDILGTDADFRNLPYRGDIGGIEGAGTFDVVCSIAVLVHLSDPLAHLAFLGRTARKALLVWTYTTEHADDEMIIEYKSVNRYYEHSSFPFCFDVMQISPGLLRRSLELMGFTEIHELKNRPDGMPDYWFDRHRGFLAIRPDDVTAENFVPERYTAPLSFALMDNTPHLVETIGNYNLVSFRGRYWGIPHAAGSIDFETDDLATIEGILFDISLNAIRGKLRHLAG